MRHEAQQFCGRPVTFCYSFGSFKGGGGVPGRRLDLEPQAIAGGGRRRLSSVHYELSSSEHINATLSASASPTLSEIVSETTWERELGSDLEAFTRMTLYLRNIEYSGGKVCLSVL